MISEALTLLLACLGSTALGAIFFGGLWWTVQRGMSADQPAVWFLVSLLVRTGIVLFGFYVISGGHPSRALACLAGFTLARPLVTWRTRPLGSSSPRSTPEVRHAP